MCGKDEVSTTDHYWHLGSPPHVRERPGIPWADIPRMGITPACAGKTFSRLDNLRSRRDHPRMCGKDAVWSPFFQSD